MFPVRQGIGNRRQGLFANGPYSPPVQIRGSHPYVSE